MTANKHALPIGTLINMAAVIVGSLVGMGLEHAITPAMENILFQAIGLGTVLIGIRMMLKLPDGYMLIFIFSLMLGGLLGVVVNLESLVGGMSDGLKAWLGVSDGRFTEGLVTAFLLFCVGSMTIVGALEEGLQGKRELLLVKSTLDGFTSVALASAMGIGVLFSILPMLIMQGGLTFFARRVGHLLREEVVDSLSAVGGALIIGISISMLNLGDIQLINLLPSLAVVTVLASVPAFRSN